MNKRLQVERIKKWIRKQGLDPQAFDIEHLVDSKLSYKQNLANIKRLVLRKKEQYEDAYEKMLESAHYYHLGRSPRSIDMDNRYKAKTVIRPNDRVTIRKIRLLNQWFKNPGRIDIEGIDYFPRYSKRRGRIRRRR